MENTPEIIFVDKPKGITSFGVVSRARKMYGVKKVGHAGTLDPLATGLMVIGLGAGTKKLKEYVGLPKEYVAEILIGEKYTTGDVDGELLEKVTTNGLDREHVKEALAEMVGVLRLPVPAYSAMKQGGQPLHRLVRAGKKFTLPVRDMEVFAAQLVDLGCAEGVCTITAEFFVESGTYVRSLAEELGRRLGYPATIQNLRRTKVGDLKVEGAEKIEG